MDFSHADEVKIQQRSSNKKMYLETKNNLDAALTWAQIFVLIAETTWIYLDIARVYHTMQ